MRKKLVSIIPILQREERRFIKIIYRPTVPDELHTEAIMLLNLTDISDEPLQGQISRQIRARILAGELDAGTSLPSIRALAREQHVSVITVQRAYEHLMREDLIHSRRGKGFFVSEIAKKQKKELAKQRLLTHLERPVQAAIAEGLSPVEIHQSVDKIIEKDNQDY
jgi:GntR family transcriptional regulator